MKKILLSLIISLAFVPCIKAEETSVKTKAEIKLEEYLQSVAPNNVVTMKTTKDLVKYFDAINYDSKHGASDTFTTFEDYYIQNYKDDNCNVVLSGISADLTTGSMDVHCFVDDSYKSQDGIKVNLKWQEGDSEGLDVVKQHINELKNQKLDFVIEDLELVKYLKNTNNYIDVNALNSDAFLKNILPSTNNIEYLATPYVYSEVPFSYDYTSRLNFGYRGTYYASIKDLNTSIHYYLYIPDNTENNEDAFMEAAQKRIDNYFGKNTIKLEKSMTINDYYESNKNKYWSEIPNDGSLEYYWEEIFGDYTTSQIGNYCYKAIIDDKEYDFIIVKDSSKINDNTISFVKNDDAGATVSILNGSVPSDTEFMVNRIEKGSNEFKKIVNTLKADSDKVMIFDFKLFSKSLNKYITKIDDGEFSVSFPLESYLQDKEVAAYYIGDDGKLEVHPITVKDGIATFKTNHFSYFTIAIRSSIKVPNTYDGISLYIVLGILGFVGVATSILLKKRTN